MRISVITIGNELLNGQTLNTNITFLGQELLAIGYSIDYQVSVNDEEEKILNILDFTTRHSDMIILVGGLGPTHDDITREVMAKFTGRKLEVNQDEFARLCNRAKKRGHKMSKQNAQKESSLIAGACFLTNHIGYASGIYLEEKKNKFYLLPGPPREFQPMVKEYILKVLPKKQEYSQVIYTSGVSEAKIAQYLEQFLNLSIDFAICAQLTGVRITLRTQEKSLLYKVVEKVKKKFALNILDSPSLEHSLVNLLQERNMSMATAESCTGGMISQYLTKVSGVSSVFKGSVVTYANSWKEKELGVDNSLLQKYGAVSKQVAKAMARGLINKYQVDCGIVVTGIAGPNSEADKPVGLVFIGSFVGSQIRVLKYNFSGDRQEIRQRTLARALNQLRCQILAL